MTPQQKPGSNISRGTIIVLLILAAMTFGFVTYRQGIIDYVRAYQFTPSGKITSIEQDLKLTPHGAHLFKASQPKLETSSTFNTSCNQKTETDNPILGCYAGQNIYIFDVTTAKLAGIEQTTAAHELLHAVYERLSTSERASLDAEIQAVYQRVKTDELAKRMEHYQKTEPGEELNELHSILGTEFDSVGDVLEAHYKKYFTNRADVLAFNKQYNGVFTSISARLKQLADTINSSVETINQQIRTHNQAVKQLEVDQAAFVAKNRSGGFTSQTTFDREQQALNTRASQLNEERDQIAAAIATSNALRDEYNALAKEYNELNQSMNSSLAPKPSL